MKLARIAGMACLGLLSMTMLSAQVLSGRVCDYERSAGAQLIGVPGARISIVLEDRTIAQQVTGSDGTYSFDKLPLGIPLTVEIQRIGYIRRPTVKQIRIDKPGAKLSDIFLLKEEDASSSDRMAARFLERLGREGATYEAESEIVAGFGLADLQREAIFAQVEQRMEAALEDIIVVRTDSPLLNERRLSTDGNMAQADLELEKIPTARDPWAILRTNPVLTDHVNMGGNESGKQAQYVGPGTYSPIWGVDGDVITDLTPPRPIQSPDPDGAKIVTEDLDRFWEAFGKGAPTFPAEMFQKVYLDRGTIGLQDFLKLRIQNAETLAKTVQAHSRYYASIRESTERIREMEKGIRASFYALEYLYSEAVYPDVYFLIGILNSGGTFSERAIVVGAEMYGRTPQTPLEELNDWLRSVLAPVESVPHLVAHELIHYQQKYPDGEPTLLVQAIREGSADFLSELISGRHINESLHAYAASRRAELWGEFKAKMHGKDFAGWLYSSMEGRPNDLGYWVGYEITRAYYDKAADKRRAIEEILEIKDFDAFLAKSGYAEQLEAEGRVVP